MAKSFFLILSFFLLTTTPAEASAPQTQQEYLERLLSENDRVKRIYENCSEDLNCLWAQLESNENRQLREQILEGLRVVREREREGQREVEEDRYSGLNLRQGLELSRSPSSNESASSQREESAIRSFFADRLREEFLGHREGKRVYNFNHNSYYQLYRTQVSRNAIEYMSSFCLESYPLALENFSLGERGFSFLTFIRPADLEKRKKVRDKHLELLQRVDSDGKNQAYQFWLQCSTQIQSICENKTSRVIPSDDNSLLTFAQELAQERSDIVFTQTPDQGGRITLDKSCQDQSSLRPHWSSLELDPTTDCRDDNYREHTLAYACAVSDNLRAARQTIEGLNQIEEKMGQFESSGNMIGAIDNANNSFEIGNEQLDINQLTAMTSAEVLDESGLDEEVEATRQRLERCREHRNEHECAEFFNFDEQARELAEQEIDEFDLRMRFVNARIQENIDDEDEMRRVLQEEGLNQQEIDVLMENPEQIAGQIADRYERSRQALIEGMRAELSLQYVSEDSFDSVYARRESELQDRVERTGQLVHFNNIIMGHIDIIDGQGERSSNAASLHSEIRGLASAFEDRQDELVRSAEESNISEPSSGGGTQYLNLETNVINQFFLGY